jgi:hypothetical protein
MNNYITALEQIPNIIDGSECSNLCHLGVMNAPKVWIHDTLAKELFDADIPGSNLQPAVCCIQYMNLTT